MVRRVYAQNSVEATMRFTRNREHNAARAEKMQLALQAAYEDGKTLIEARQHGEKTPAYITRSVERGSKR